MGKLVWQCYETDGISYGYTISIPFEYSSKDDFVLHVLSLVEKQRKNPQYPNHFAFSLFEVCRDCKDWEKIEEEVFTLDEWFENHKEEVK